MTRAEVVQDEIIEMVTSQITPGFAHQRKEKSDFYSKCDGSCFFLGGGVFVLILFISFGCSRSQL